MITMGRDISVQIITATSVENLQNRINTWLKGCPDIIHNIKYSDSGNSQGTRTVSNSFSAMIIYGERGAT